MATKSNLDQFIEDLDTDTLRELAGIALKIGYTYGGRFEPDVTTARMAHDHLEKISAVLHDGEPLSSLELYLHNFTNHDLQYVNRWRQVMGEKLLDTLDNEVDGDEICSECGAGFHDDNHNIDGMCTDCVEMRADDENEEN